MNYNIFPCKDLSTLGKKRKLTDYIFSITVKAA